MKYLPLEDLEAAANADLDAYRHVTGCEPVFPLNLADFLDKVFGLALCEVDMQALSFKGVDDPRSILGGLYPEGYEFMGREKVVIVDGRIECPGRKRFTVAHEAGHYSLHTAAGAAMGVYNRTAEPFLCREIGFSKAPLEFQADRYASALLMPAEYFPMLVVRGREIDMAASGRVLTERFGVSRQAAEIRLRDLGFRVRGEKYTPEVAGNGEKAFERLVKKGMLNVIL